MKSVTIFAIGGLLIFCAGILVGRYTVVDTNSSSNILSRTQPPKLIPNMLAKTDNSIDFPTDPKILEQVEQQKLSITPSAPPLPLIFTAEDKAQLAAQEREAKQANIKQIAEMIKSLQESKAPAEHIKHFQELKKVMEEELRQ